MSAKYSHTEVASLEVRRAFSSWGKAGRVVSGLLKAAAKRKEIGTEFHSGRVSGNMTWYVMTDEQLAAIRAEAVKRGDEALRVRPCTPVTIEQAAAKLAAQ